MTKLKFIIDKKYDAAMLKEFGLEPSFSAAKKLANQEYKKSLKYLQKTKNLYQQSWDEVNNRFFGLLAKKTGYPLKYQTYYCVVSAFHRGISNWGGNKIARIWRENPYTMRKITAHELIIPHIFNIYEVLGIRDKVSDEKIWQIAEISGWALTGLDKDFVKLWPWISEQEKWYYTHNYPQLVPLQKKLKPMFLKRRNFSRFLEQAIKYTQ